MLRSLFLSVLVLILAGCQSPTPPKPGASTNSQVSFSTTNRPLERVDSIIPPKHPIPPESQSGEVTKFAFLVYGDTRGRRDGKEIQYEHSLIVDSMLATIKKYETNGFPVRFVLQSGDAVVNGRDPKQWNKSFVGLINRITSEAGIPYFLAPGNHDVTAAAQITNADRKIGLSNYLSAVTQLIPPDGAPRRLDGYPTYAFGYGNSFFVAIDSNLAGDKAQYDWAVGQLQTLNRKRFTNVFFFFHHPPFSSGPHGGATVETAAAELRKSYMPLFRKHHVKAIFAGHEHLFEHWIERYQDAATNKYRMDMIVTGGGGAPLYGYRGEPRLTEYLKAFESEKVALEHLVRPGPDPGDNPYHYVIVKIDGTRMSLEVVGIDWGTGYKPYRSNRTDLSD